jgi:hypothetical protein
VERSDGEPVRWEGFWVGPMELTPQELEEIAQRLLGLPLEAVPAAAEPVLLPSIHDDGTGPCIVIHSATPVLRNLQGDLEEMTRGHADDTATYMETRSVCLARPGDLVVGRSVPWRMAAEHSGIEAITVPPLDLYYLSQGLIKLMADSDGQAPQVQRMIAFLREHPDTVVRLYSLDLELQIALLYLMREAGLPRLFHDANSPEVAGYWNAKAPVYPRVTDVSALTADSPDELLRAETEFAPMRKLLGLTYERLPGYAFAANNPLEMLDAARLLRSRYAITTGCLKPSKGGGGARIIPGLDLSDEEELQNHLKAFLGTGELLILEAQVDYTQLTIGDRSVKFAPSAHVRRARLADGLTVQLSHKAQWQGNIYIDQRAGPSIGISSATYDTIRRTVEDLRTCLRARTLQLNTGGIDFAVGTVGGAFKDRRFVAIQDPNLSSHGAEYLRRFVDYMDAIGGPRCAATKVVKPTFAGDLLAILNLPHPPLHQGTRFQVIAAVPGRWGMLAAAATTPHLAVQEVLNFERNLIANSLARESA